MKTALLETSSKYEAKYLAWLKRQPLSPQTRRAYAGRINRFLTFLDASGEVIGKLLQNEREREHVIREYKRELKLKRQSSPATVNAHLTAVDHLFEFLGAISTKVARENLPQEAPRALSKAEQKRFLRSAAACRRSKDRAVALLLLYTGIRISECANLNEQDVSIAGRRQRIIVRSGKGDRYREIPLNTEAREALRQWLYERSIKYSTMEDALFLNPQGKRLSTSSLDLIVRKIGEGCGLPISAHVLRHTCLTNLVRNGMDLSLVAEIGGHKRLESTLRYTLPSLSDKEKAMESLQE